MRCRSLFVVLLALASATSGYGTTEPAGGLDDIADAQHDGARDAVGLTRGQHGLRASSAGASARLTITRTNTRPVIILNGSRSSVQELVLISADAVTDIEVLTSTADTMVYGQDAALAGVVRVEARVGL